MNNKTVVAVLVLILVALAGVGVGKYAHNYNMKQEAASVKSQQVVPVNNVASKGKVVTPVTSGGPKPTTSLACGLTASIGPVFPPNSLHLGALVMSNFTITNSCAYPIRITDFSIQLIPSGYNFRAEDSAYVFDNTSTMLAELDVATSTPIQYNFSSPTIIIPGGATHSFEARAAIVGMLGVGDFLATRVVGMSGMIPSMGNAPAVWNNSFPLSGQVLTY